MTKTRIITAVVALALAGSALASGATQEEERGATPGANGATSSPVASAPHQAAAGRYAASDASASAPSAYGRPGVGGAEPAGGAPSGADRRDRLRQEQHEEFLHQVWSAP